ncbi:hypothetical protein INT48_005269 [Thamnidium elegans]|uniref:F-box domain-containing protein n=1 Tax=Thamnidium elegans TaxID=101142 RepID=A0A8H7SSX7_9FUNG|nr:hypothetical protein INT48_005269 [Thamnidium elegans]
MSICNIPHELYALVFSHLSRNNIYQCMLVCKYWYSLAVEAYYYRVILLPKNIDYLKSNILHQTCRQPEYGRWVKHLKLNLSESTLLTTKEFETLILYFPNLTHIDILDCPDQIMYLQVLKTIGETGLQHLQVIETETKDLLAFHQFSKRLTRLNLDRLEKVYTINGICGNVVSFLPDFTHLTSLRINNGENDSGDIVIFQILNACQNLVDFTYIGYFTPTENIEDYQTRATIASVSFHGNKHLKHIELFVNTFSYPLIQYFTACIPLLHLLSFSLTIESDFSYWIYKNGSSSTMEFASCLTSINNLYISFGNIRENIYDVQTKVLNYWTFLGAIKGNRNTFNQTNYLVSQDEKKPELLISLINGDILTFECGIWVPDYFVTNAASGVSNFSMPVLPATIGVGPWITDELNIEARENLKGVSIHLLKFSLNHCPQLKEFWIRSSQNNGIEFFAGGKDMCQIQTKRLTLSYNLLKVMFERLPNITEFVAYQPILVKDDAFSNNTRVNFSGFKQLKELVIDLQNIHIKSFEHVFLRLEHINSSNEYYKIKTLSGQQNYSLTATTANFIQAFYGSSIILIIQFNNKLCKITLEDNGKPIGTLPLLL